MFLKSLAVVELKQLFTLWGFGGCPYETATLHFRKKENRMTIQNCIKGVTVIHGANEGVFDLAGSTVSEIQSSLVDAFNLRSNAVAFVNGEEVELTFTLNAGDRLEFVHRKGTKGLGDLLTPEDLMSRWRISPEEYSELQQVGLPTVSFNNGTIRHPEVSVDDWMRQFRNSAPSTVLHIDEQNNYRSWLNSTASIPPSSHKYGPLTGTQEQLASRLHPYGKSDPRFLRARAVNGVVWVRKVHARLYEVWFRSQFDLERASPRK